MINADPPMISVTASMSENIETIDQEKRT